ncbi:DUF6039 family protein [Streptomyces sp. NBC_01485]|uniref:DUF6039 family protein n=1 Tax=Streptomyces sp. NBC_01485 TaxID=2903884 RepID=UPI002E33BA52|nr:DUF6039 family protein [Streptomyces sp. NBC_01485]
MAATSNSEFVLPVAQLQTSVPAADTLNSANSGVIVERTGQLRAEFRSEGRQFARDLSEYLNRQYVGIASTFVYEETFGTKDTLHWLLHMRSLEAYEHLVQMGSTDEGWREVMFRNRIPQERGGGSWDRMFLDGGLKETVLIPQSFGMYGTADSEPETLVSPDGGMEWLAVPTAQHQTSQKPDEVLHSANCGIVMHRTGELKYEFRSEGREFARALTDSWNSSLGGLATIFLYEEAFGLSDRIHWFIHLKQVSTYYNLMGLRARTDPKAREAFTKEWIPKEKGGGGWERMFVQGSLKDMALTPQHWGMYATKASPAGEPADQG